MYLDQQQDRASSPARNFTPTDQPQRKPVGRWCLAGNVKRPGVEVGQPIRSWLKRFYWWYVMYVTLWPWRPTLWSWTFVSGLMRLDAVPHLSEIEQSAADDRTNCRRPAKICVQ